MISEHDEPTAKLRSPQVGDPLGIPDDPRLMAAVKEYLAEIEAGRVPDRQAIFRRYPDLVGALKECLDGLDLVHKGAPRSAPSTPVRGEPGDSLHSSPLGDFQIVREIGRGGMGVVYEATQLSLGRRVALKVLPFAATFDAKHLQRFRTEAQAAALLHHTNIVPVYAVGCERGVHFYAMQLIEGKTLAELIAEMRRQKKKDSPPSVQDLAGMIEASGGAASEPRTLEMVESATTPMGVALSTKRSTDSREFFRTVARLIKQAADGLEHAHSYGIIHRDIKPANLLVDAQARLWITDFGLAQFHNDVALTKTGDVVGTLRYMSPEQASGQRVVLDHRTDVYSLGATLYELATLEPIFGGQDQRELLRQILHDEPRTPRTVDSAVPVELETIILKAVNKNPTERYASAKEMADDLLRYLEDKPILAKRPGVIERVRKWSRRHPSFVAATVLVLLFGAIGLAISTAAIAHSLEREKKRAEEAEQRFGLARRWADEMIQLSEVEMADNPALQNLRRQLLEAALIYYQELIELRRDDPDAQADLAITRDNVKGILSDLAVLQSAAHLFLLRHPEVQDDLKLKGDDRQQVIKWANDLDKKHQDSFRVLYKLPQEERQKRMVEMALSNEAEMEAVLDPGQIARLRQIALQCQGPLAFRDPQVVAALKLTADQRKQIRSLEGQLFFDKRDFDKKGKGPKGPPPKGEPKKGGEKGQKGESWKGPMGEAFNARRKDVMTQIAAVLTPEQATQWSDMIGRPFESKMPIFMPGAMFSAFGPPPPEGFGPPRKKDFKDRK